MMRSLWEQDVVRGQTNLLADAAGNDVIIAGQDFCANVVLPEFAQSLRCGVLGRIQKGHISEQG
jgi:hypothetical protein